jgi:hypothetical protein
MWKTGLRLSVCLFVFLLGCVSRGPTELCGKFKSYQTVDEVRAELSKIGVLGAWKEESKDASSDRRPGYQFVALSGPFVLSGINGNLALTFYNGQLMEARFSPSNSKDYLAALRTERSQVPDQPHQEIVTSRRTRFRFDPTSGGNLVFTWYDPKLESEWQKWVASNS